jgi:hypothetical protein
MQVKESGQSEILMCETWATAVLALLLWVAWSICGMFRSGFSSPGTYLGNRSGPYIHTHIRGPVWCVLWLERWRNSTFTTSRPIYQQLKVSKAYMCTQTQSQLFFSCHVWNESDCHQKDNLRSKLFLANAKKMVLHSSCLRNDLFRQKTIIGRIFLSCFSDSFSRKKMDRFFRGELSTQEQERHRLTTQSWAS